MQPVTLLIAQFSRRLRPSIVGLAPLLLAACSEDEGRKHRYLNTPPTPAVRPASPMSAPVPEPAIGSVPSARLMSVRDAATGAPSSLDDIRAPVEILAMVSRGRAVPASRPVRVELELRGPVDTVLAEAVGAVVPLVVALPFHLDVGGPGGLRPGRYEALVRIAGEGMGSLAESVPVPFVIRP